MGKIMNDEHRLQEIRETDCAGFAFQHKAHQGEDAQVDQRTPQDELRSLRHGDLIVARQIAPVLELEPTVRRLYIVIA
jgi:hypothetical protein